MRRSFAWMYLTSVSFGAVACGASDASSFADGSAVTMGAAGASAGGGRGGAAPITGAGAGPAAGGGAGAAAQPPPFAPTGSLDLLVTKVDVSQAMGPTAKTAPSMGVKLRIDLPDFKGKGQKGQSAIVTPRWGQPAVFNATLGADAIELTGSATIHGDGATDVWQSITISLGAGGKATGAVTVSGQESVFASGVGYSGKIVATGVLAPDATAPEGKAGQGSSFADAPLPWEPLRATFAEPIAKSEVEGHLSVVDAGGAAAPYAFVLTPEVPSGAVVALAYASSWDGAGSTVSLRLAPGYVDAASNVGEGFQQPASVVAVAKATSPFAKFDGASVPAFWGGAEKLADATCESAACVVLGPFANAHCGVAPAGVAVRLAAPPSPYGGKVRVRYRVLYAGGGATNATVVPLSVQVARVGVAPTTHDLAKPPAAQALGTGAGDFAFGTPWSTIELSLPSGAAAGDEIGVAIRAGGEGSAATCSPEAPVEAPSLTKVVIDSVSVN